MAWNGRWSSVALAVLLLGTMSFASAQPDCPPPSGCWALVDGIDSETDVGGVEGEGGVFKQEDDDTGTLTQAAALWPLLAASAQSSGPTFDIGDQGGVAMRFAPGSSDSRGRSHVEMRVEFQEVRGIAWMNGTTMDFTYNLTAGQAHYEAVYFVVTERMEGPINIPFRVTANPAQRPDHSTGSPTGSPTASPTASPTGSPTGSPPGTPAPGAGGDESFQDAQVQVHTEGPPDAAAPPFIHWLSFFLGLALGVVVSWFLLARKKSGTGGSGRP